jgi:hypothetical protein
VRLRVDRSIDRSNRSGRRCLLTCWRVLIPPHSTAFYRQLLPKRAAARLQRWEQGESPFVFGGCTDCCWITSMPAGCVDVRCMYGRNKVVRR